MDKGRYYDLQLLQAELDKTQTMKRRNMLRERMARIARQIRDPKMTDYRKAMIYYDERGDDGRREYYEKKLRERELEL